jgi:DNA-binding XRE family transcriptional regulator
MFRNNLKTLRKKNTNYTQADAAALLDVSLDTYASYEKGRRKPKQQTLINIAELLKCTVDEIMEQ